MDVQITVSHGLLRRVFVEGGYVQWVPKTVFDRAGAWDYAVYKFPFVSGFHVCQIHDDNTPEGYDDWSQILSSHKTLHEAMGVCKVLLANGGAHYE